MDVERAIHVIEIKGHPYNHIISKSHSNFTSMQKKGTCASVALASSSSSSKMSLFYLTIRLRYIGTYQYLIAWTKLPLSSINS